MKFLFPEKLAEGVIKSRPNRFIMVVEAEGRTMRCHCPSTGRIGSLRFKDISCLLSKSRDAGRKTPYTVEAISLDAPDARRKRWIGINPVAANKYVEFFLTRGALAKMVKGGERARRERKLGKSRIDFAIGDKTYIEVKTLLMDLETEGHPQHRKTMPKFTSFQRLIKHFGELSKALRHGSRAIVLLCYLYDAKPFKVPPPDKGTMKIQRAAQMAQKAGVENWQIDLVVDGGGVTLSRYFPLRLF